MQVLARWIHDLWEGHNGRILIRFIPQWLPWSGGDVATAGIRVRAGCQKWIGQTKSNETDRPLPQDVCIRANNVGCAKLSLGISRLLGIILLSMPPSTPFQQESACRSHLVEREKKQKQKPAIVGYMLVFRHDPSLWKLWCLRALTGHLARVASPSWSQDGCCSALHVNLSG